MFYTCSQLAQLKSPFFHQKFDSIPQISPMDSPSSPRFPCIPVLRPMMSHWRRCPSFHGFTLCVT